MKKKKYNWDSYSLYIEDISKYPLLTEDEETELAMKMEAGDENAKMRFIQSNLRLVVSQAKRYMGALPLMDLIQDGNEGLIRAVDRFDYRKGCRFSTYAIWWIRQGITRGIENSGRLVRLPAHMHEKIQKYKKAKQQLENDLSMEPSIEDLADYLELSVKETAALENYLKDAVSLDQTLGEENDTTLGDMTSTGGTDLSESSFESPEEIVIRESMEEMVEEFLAGLPDREAEVLKYRFGLCGYEKKTLEKTGEIFNLTRERVRQIENLAIRRIGKMAKRKGIEYVS